MKTIGIDEVGRGCWAGPLVAAAVALGTEVPGLRDSKKLSASQRERLAAQVHATARAVGIGWVWPAEVDTMGVTEAVRTAMQRALTEVQTAYDDVVIDGNINYLAEWVDLPVKATTRAVVKADDSVPSVSAASIVAKVARDRYMAGLGVQWPERYAGYGFEKHVGYGTAAHIAALKTLGVSDVHRRSYKPIRALLAGAGQP